MTVYILLFRGVGGKTQLPTARLRNALTEAGFERVATYINSGNAVVSTNLKRDEAVARVGEICRRAFNFDKAIYAVSAAEWKKLIANNPFPKAVASGNLLHAAVLAARPKAGDLKALEAIARGGDRIAVVGKVAYLHTPNGFSKSKLAEKFDRGIGVPNTARNWNTVLKLQDLVAAAGKS